MSLFLCTLYSVNFRGVPKICKIWKQARNGILPVILNIFYTDFFNFQKNWPQKMSKIRDIEMHDHFETTFARLVALSSMDSVTALIHDKMTSISLQSIQIKQKDLNT